MNIFLNYLILIIAAAFAAFYSFTFILNIVRSNKVRKELKTNCAKLKATVAKIVTHKKKTYVKVKFKSPKNDMLFEMFFEYFTTDWADRAKVGDEINLIYPDVANLKRVYSFPVFIEGDKIKMPKGPFVTDLMLVLFAIYVVVSIVVNMATHHAFTENVSVTKVTPMIMLVLYIIMHVLLVTYAIDRLFNAPTEENNNYLQIYGEHRTGEVTTFKFAGSKNARGFKEAQMEVEFFNELGEKIKTHCSSYYYSETQEQFINMLVDPNNPKNVVYMKQPEKTKHKKDKKKNKEEN